MIYEAYLDESGCDDQSKILVVGGYVIAEPDARIMERKWKTLLERYKVPFFHMVDCAHGAAHFKDIPKAKRANFAQKIIELTLKYKTFGFAFAAPVARQFPVKGYDVYTSAILHSAILLQATLKCELFGESVTLNIEAGHKSAPAARACLDGLKGDGNFDRIAGYSFVGKQEAVLSQAADLLCWQVAKNIKSMAFDSRPSRKDYQALISENTTIFYAWQKDDRMLLVSDPTPHLEQPTRNEVVIDLFRRGEVTSNMLTSWQGLPRNFVQNARGGILVNKMYPAPPALFPGLARRPPAREVS